MPDLNFVTIETITEKGEDRNVSLAYGWNKNPEEVNLLGNLPHMTQIIINQKLVDDLQKVVDYLNSLKEIK